MSTNVYKFYFSFILLCLGWSLALSFMCPNTNESYHNDKTKVSSFNPETLYTVGSKFQPFESHFRHQSWSVDEDVLGESKKLPIRRQGISSSNATLKSSGDSEKIVNLVLNAYQNDFELMYPRGSNYSEIFQDTAPNNPFPVLPSRTAKNYEYSSFPSLSEIWEHLERLEKLSKGRANVCPLKFHNGSWNLVRTNFENEILSIRISQRNLDEAQVENPIIVVVAGIHGKDWYAIQSAIFLATELINNRNRTSEGDFDWWIIPVLNPDGYEISQTHERWRNWEKNLYGTQDPESTDCFGLDLDLSFEYRCLDCSTNPCDFNYPGDVPFLAPEAEGLRDTLEAFSDCIDTFIALKEGKQMLVYPFADTFQSPQNVESFEKISKEAVQAFAKNVEGSYEYGQSSCLLNISSGFIEDWAKVHLGVDKSFAFYLGPTSKDRRELKSQHLMAHLNGTLDLINILAQGQIGKVENSASRLDFPLFFVATILIVQLNKTRR